MRGATLDLLEHLVFALISIHAPREGSDANIRFVETTEAKFQSTLPVRGATAPFLLVFALISFQSTLPVRGATASKRQRSAQARISIHAPREGSD